MKDINAYKFKAQLLQTYISSVLTGNINTTITETANSIIVTVVCPAYNFDIVIFFEEIYLDKAFGEFHLQKSYRYYGTGGVKTATLDNMVDKLNSAYGLMVDSTKCKRTDRSANSYSSCTFSGDFYSVVCDIQNELFTISYSPYVGSTSLKAIEIYRITFSDFEQNKKLCKKTIRKVLVVDIPEYNKRVAKRYEELILALRSDVKNIISIPVEVK